MQCEAERNWGLGCHVIENWEGRKRIRIKIKIRIKISFVAELLDEPVQAGEVRLKVLLIIAPTSEGSPVHRFGDVGVRRGFHALGLSVFVELEDFLVKSNAQKIQG